MLDGVRGQGQYVGTYLALSTLERYWWGEGEMKFYIDGDKDYPTICGTGTEDYFGGAWSFTHQEGGRSVEQTYCTPFLGYPYYSHRDQGVHNDYHNDDCPPMRGFYRWHILDPIRFSQDLRVTLQQIGVVPRGDVRAPGRRVLGGLLVPVRAPRGLPRPAPRPARWPR